MRLLLALLLLSFATVAEAQPLPPLQGDAEAIARMERMFARMGGRAPWARARSMYIHYRQLSSGTRAGEGQERAWRDLTRPRERLEWVRTEYDGRGSAWARSNDQNGGWRRTAEGVRPYSAEELRQAVNFWSRDFYTMLRRIAAGDPALRLRFAAPNRIAVTDPSGGALGWWDVDVAGTPMRWGTTDDDDANLLSYIYGPLRRYGDISFPAWGVSADGVYRFEYLDFAISEAPLPDEAFADPSRTPRRDLRLR